MVQIIHYFQLLIFIMLFFSMSASYADVVVPDVMNLKIEDAQTTLKNRGLSNVSVKTQRTNRPVDTVIVQAPPAGTRVTTGYRINLVVAIPLIKQKRTKVPNLKGLSLSQAKLAIRSANLTVGTIKKRKIKMEDIEVIYQSPKAGKGLQVKSRVDFIISDPIEVKGARVQVALDKKKFTVGESTIIRAKVSNADTSRKVEYGFSINGRTRYSSSPSYQYTFPKSGRYIITASFRYARGAWSASLSRTVNVSKNTKNNTTQIDEKPTKKKEQEISTSNKPKKIEEKKKDKQEKKEDRYVDVPNVVGLSEKSAISAIKRRGLRVGRISEKEDKSGKRRILKQSPRAGKKVKKGSKVSLLKSIPTTKTKAWQKPKAIIFPATVTVIQGERAVFQSKSTYDKSSKLFLQWSSKQDISSTRKRFRLKTQNLEAGKYWIKLIVKDSKKYSDGASALLIVKEKETAETAVEKHNGDTTNKNSITEDPSKDQVASPEKIQNEKESVNEQTINQAIMLEPSLDAELNELLKNKQNSKPQIESTTDSSKIASLSETTVQPQVLSSRIPQNKVVAQNTEDLKQDGLGEPNTSLTTNHNTSNISKTLFNTNNLPFSWKVLIWLSLILFIIFALLLVLWSYRKHHKPNNPVVNFHLKDDDGEQQVLGAEASVETSLNSIHFSSQVDNGEQDVRLKD